MPVPQPVCSRLPTLTMVSRSFLANQSNIHHIQPPKCRARTKVILSAEARKLLNLDRQEKTERFKQDMNNAFEKLDEMTKTIASKHGKSIHCVQNGLHLGHAKFRTKRNKINAWNAFCWKKRQLAQGQNGECVIDAISI